MSGFLAIFRKEVRTYFYSPVAYVFVAGFLFLVAIFFGIQLNFYIEGYLLSQQNPLGMGASDINEFVRDGTINFMVTFLLFLTPLLTMRLVAAEKRAKTDELLFTSPISVMGILAGKYAASLLIMALALAVSFYVPLCTAHIGPLDWPPVLLGYAGLLVLGGGFIALGLFASSLTQDQVIAAVISFVAALGLLVLSFVGSSFDTPWLKSAFEYAAYQGHFDRLSKGIVDTRDLVYLASFAGLFLYLAYRYLSAGQWRTQMAAPSGKRRWILLVAGIVLILAYALLEAILRTSDVAPEHWRQGIWVAGCLLIAAYVAWDWESLLDRVRTRSFLSSSLAWVEVLAVVALIAGGNYLASRRHWKWDFTDVGLYTLAPQSLKVARGFTDEVEIAVFMQQTEPTRPRLKELLALYQDENEKIRLRFIDPDRSPTEARKYNVDLYNTVVFSRGTQRTQITSHTEEDITSALIKIGREGERTICFVTGHGEKDIDSDHVAGFETARRAVEGQGYTTKKVNLVQPGALMGCTVVVVPGPTKRPLPAELDALSAYVEGGGRVLLLLDPLPAEVPGQWLAGYGLEAHDDVVVDPAGVVVGGSFLSTVATPPFEAHEITAALPGQMLFAGVRTLSASDEPPEGLSIAPLVRTREDVWGETSIEREDPPEFNPDRDRPGPLVIAYALEWPAGATKAEKKAKKDAKEEAEGEGAPSDGPKVGGRMVVVGDSDFANNRYIYAYGFNSDFFLNSISWLANESNLVSIRPRKRDMGTITIPSKNFQTALFLLPTLVGPGLILAMGLGIWIRRRRS